MENRVGSPHIRVLSKGEPLSSIIKESIIEIWSDCFTDELDYISLFIERVVPNSYTFLLSPNRSLKPVAIASLLPSYSELEDGSIVRGGYLYGVGTLESARGAGYSKTILERIVEEALAKELSYIVTRPATPSLYSLYEKQGFSHTLFATQINIDLLSINEREHKTTYPIQSQSGNISTIFQNKILEKYASMNQELLLWDGEIASYAIKETFDRGGGAVDFNDGLLFLHYPINEDEIAIPFSSVMGQQVEIEKISQWLRNNYPDHKRATLEIPNTTAEITMKDSEPIRNGLLMLLTPPNESSRSQLLKRSILLPME